MRPGNCVTQAVWRAFGTFEGDTARRLTIVLVVLRAGATLSVGISEGLLSLHLLEGRLQLVADSAEQLSALSQGQLLALHAGVPYRASALAEATLLLRLAGQTRPPEAGRPTCSGWQKT